MTQYKPRRPAQLELEQIELIEGGVDTAVSSELAHTAAQAVVPLKTSHELDSEIISRVQTLIAEEGIDTLAEAWVTSPETSLPGILWRGYLLREWIRRYSEDVTLRFAGAAKHFKEIDPQRLELVLNPERVQLLWDEVFRGNFTGDFCNVLRASARFLDFIGSLAPIWIADDEHPLATVVTRRDTALLRTAQEFRGAGEALVKNNLV